MPKRTYEKKLHIDMPFDDALERFSNTNPNEMEPAKKKTSDTKPLVRTGKAPPKRKRHLSESDS